MRRWRSSTKPPDPYTLIGKVYVKHDFPRLVVAVIESSAGTQVLWRDLIGGGDNWTLWDPTFLLWLKDAQELS